jgi:murein DD-endopeptidase MepM/ murein hydrolase activator NlpD
MIMPETATAEVRRMRVSRRLIVWAIGAVASFVLIAIVSVAWSLSLLSDAREAEVLRTENSTLRGEIDSLDHRLENVVQVVDRLEHFESKLRTLTMISDPERNLAMGPVEGPENETKAKKTTNELKRDLMTDKEAAIFTSANVGLAEKRAESVIAGAEKLSVLLEGQHALLSATPSRRPSRGYVTSLYGMRIDPFTGLTQLHSGIDFSARLGAPAHATGDGMVIFSGKQGAYGNLVEVDHGHGLVTRYAHLGKMHVKIGEKVKRGQAIAEIGNTGRSTGPHLHYEIRVNGIPQDPRRFMLE